MLNREWLSAFVPLGVVENSDAWRPVGAGVLFIEGQVVWLLTAAHVIGGQGKGVVPLLTLKGGRGVTVLDLPGVHRSHGLDWQTDNERDLACALMPTSDDFDIKAVDRSTCLRISEAVPSMSCFTIGCPYGVRGFDPKRATPLVQDGVIAGVDEDKDLIYFTAPTFPGNSGGPLIAVKSPFSPEGGAVIGDRVVYFAGIVTSYAIVRGNMELGDLPPLHLGVAAGAGAVTSLIQSDGCRAQIDRVKPMAS